MTTFIDQKHGVLKWFITAAACIILIVASAFTVAYADDSTDDPAYESEPEMELMDEETDTKCGDNLTWTLEDGVLTISGTGDMYEYGIIGYSSRPWVDQLESIKTVVVEEGVTNIGAGAFYDCWELEKVTIPDSVTEICFDAFRDCYCLKSIDIPDSVTSIGAKAFMDSGLENVSYSGSRTEWNKVNIDNYENEPLKNAAFTFGNTQGEKPYNVVSVHGVWTYLGANGNPDYTYYGFASNVNGTWLIKAGKVSFSTSEVVKGNDGSWYYVSGGKVQFNYTGIQKNQYGWWRIVNGKVDFSATGVYKNEYGWWYCKGGKVQFGYTGLASNSYGTWYIKNGKVDFSYTGYYGGSYIRGGKVVS